MTLQSGGVVNHIVDIEGEVKIFPITCENISFVDGVVRAPSELFFGVPTENHALYPNLEGFLDMLTIEQVKRELLDIGLCPKVIERILDT